MRSGSILRTCRTPGPLYQSLPPRGILYPPPSLRSGWDGLWFFTFNRSPAPISIGIGNSGMPSPKKKLCTPHPGETSSCQTVHCTNDKKNNKMNNI